jgi:hypothetical protein
MLTLGGKLRDFVERAATDRKKSRRQCAFGRWPLVSFQRWARTKPACWAASSLLNQTSATVRP